MIAETILTKVVIARFNIKYEEYSWKPLAISMYISSLSEVTQNIDRLNKKSANQNISFLKNRSYKKETAIPDNMIPNNHFTKNIAFFILLRLLN
jgi:hypothetical protein